MRLSPPPSLVNAEDYSNSTIAFTMSYFRPILILSGIVGLLLALSGCGPAYERRMACKSQVGPEPYAHGDIFGPIGVAIAEAQPERIAYRAAVQRCVEGSVIMGRQ